MTEPASTRKARAASKIDIVVLALAATGGDAQVVDTEDVAVAAHKLAPETFRWRKYPDQIDLDMVRTTLRHAAERETPRVTGSVRTGWNLTREGVQWMRAHGRVTTGSLAAETPANTTATRKENLAERRETERLRSHPAYRKYLGGYALTAADAGGVFRIDVYTPMRERSLKVQRLRTAVGADSDLTAFLEAAAVLIDGLSGGDTNSL